MTTLRLGVLACAAALAAACRPVIVMTPPPREDRPAPTVVTLGIPPGHLPRVGECRVWLPGTPPGRQPRPRSRTCLGISRVAPAASWIVYRPARDRRLVRVRVLDQRRPGVIVIVRLFDVDGRFLRDEQPGWEDRDEPEDRPRQERPREERPRPPEERPRPPEERPADPNDLGIPPGHLPSPGECRLWNPGTPPGLQRSRPTTDCAGLVTYAPPGSWIIYRPTRDRNVVHVRVVDERRRGTVVLVRIFDIGTGRFVRETRPEDEPRDEEPNIQQPDRDMPPIQRPPEQRPPDQRPPENKPPENKPPEQRPPDQRPPENKPPENKPPENKPPEQRPPDQRPPENKPPENKPPEQRPQDQRPPENKPPENKPPEQRPPDQRPPENKPPEQRPQDQRPPENKPRDERPRDQRPGTERGGPGGPSTAATLGIPTGQLPGAGECRLWIPGMPPGRQRSAATTDCAGLARTAPAGSWVVYRPGDDQKVVHVRIVDAQRAGVITTVRVFDIESGKLMREEQP